MAVARNSKETPEPESDSTVDDKITVADVVKIVKDTVSELLTGKTTEPAPEPTTTEPQTPREAESAMEELIRAAAKQLAGKSSETAPSSTPPKAPEPEIQPGKPSRLTRIMGWGE